MACDCISWARIPADSYPMANHHPDCKLHVKEEFTRLEHDGHICVMEPIEAQQIEAGSEENYTVSTVMLTRDQFDNLPEFAGF